MTSEYKNYRFDKEGMEELARNSIEMLEDYSMRKELEELEEENYYALSKRYKNYSTLKLIRKLFELIFECYRTDIYKPV